MHASKPKLLTLAVISASFLNSPAFSQDNANPFEEIIVTSSLIPVPMRQIGTSVSFITEAEIDAHGNLSLVDVLRQMPAIASRSPDARPESPRRHELRVGCPFA